MSATTSDVATPGAAGTTLWNWGHDVVTHPAVVMRPRSANDIVQAVKDAERYPSPVRAHGSAHSVTYCLEADGGTILDLSGLNRVLEIGPEYVRAEAGAILYDVAQELRRHNLQFYVNIEIGNTSIGAAACCATKDASFPGEFGAGSSYCIGMKLVTPSGDLLELTEDDPESLQIARSSYGLLGIVYEATFRVRPLQSMAVEHVLYTLEDFIAALPELMAEERSLMMFFYPFADRVVVELRRYMGPAEQHPPPGRAVWRTRNFFWQTFISGVAHALTASVPVKPVRYFLIDRLNATAQRVSALALRDANTSPTDQMIRFPDDGGFSKYTFSICAFPEERFPETVRDYFAWAKRYYREHGYRSNLCDVGYRILQDRSSLFSPTWNGNGVSIDPISTGDAGWLPFLRAYNEFCDDHDGSPLFNQTPELEPAGVRKAFGERLDRFNEMRKIHDPGERLLNGYFRRLLES